MAVSVTFVSENATAVRISFLPLARFHCLFLLLDRIAICFMPRILLPIVNVKMLRMIYFAHFQSQISYDMIFWGSSSSMRNVLFVITKKQQLGLCLDWVGEVLVERV
jgi:hypothetical protein